MENEIMDFLNNYRVNRFVSGYPTFHGNNETF